MQDVANLFLMKFCHLLMDFEVELAAGRQQVADSGVNKLTGRPWLVLGHVESSFFSQGWSS